MNSSTNHKCVDEAIGTFWLPFAVLIVNCSFIP